MSYLYESLQSIKTDWKEVVKSYDFTDLNKFLGKEYETYGEDVKIFPPKPLIFNCFNFFDINELKVVILGQDPYIKEGQAMGLAFSVPEGIRVPPSLRNVIKEITPTDI
jgi:uracil-DNA glycosylase